MFQRLSRLKRKIRLTCDLLIGVMRMDPTLVSSKAQAIEVVNYDLPYLASLKATLRECEKEWERLDDVDEDLADLIDSTSQRALGWERAVTDLQRKFYMHLKPGSSLLKKVDLLPFTGSPESETIYQFLSTFHRLADMSCDPSEQADLLYNSYLSPSIQLEVFSFKTQIDRVEEWLISQYGDLRRIADSRVARVAALKHPTPGQSTSAQIDYYKSIHQLLMHLESLSQCERVDQHEIGNIIFNASWVTQLVARLPEEAILAFTKVLEREPRIPPVSGRRHFELLKDLIDTTWRQLNTAHRIRSARDPGNGSGSKPHPPPRSVNNAAGPSSGKPQGSAPPRAQAGVPASRGSSAVCPFHDLTVQARHPIGHCNAFFKASNQQRLELCKKAKACFSCLSVECMRVSFGACITSQLPAELLCGDCAQTKQKRPLNVLLCSNTSHPKPPLKVIQDALGRYLKPFDARLSDHLRPQFNLTSAAGQLQALGGASPSNVLSKSSPVDPSKKIPVFDTTNGASVPCPQSVRVESDNDSIYIFQMIKTNGHTGLVFYDSGATGNLVKGVFAEAAGFKVLDPASRLVGALGSTSMWTKYGLYSATLGDETRGSYHQLTFQGIDKITSNFPQYDLGPILNEVRATGQFDSKEPLPRYVGGRSTDILIGLKSSELQPRLLFTLPSGLGVYRCLLKDCWGSDIAFGGPHELISSINKRFYGFSVNHMSVLLTHLASPCLDPSWIGFSASIPSSMKPLSMPITNKQSVVLDSTPVCRSDALLCGLPCHDSLTTVEPLHEPDCPSQACKHGCPVDRDMPTLASKAKVPLSKIRQLMDGDSEPLVSYRCPQCEDCSDCKASATLKSSSLRERAEQKLIEASVRIDYEQSKTFVRYPFLSDPVVFFKKHFAGKSSNQGQARLVYFQQCRKREEDKLGVRSEMQKLLDAGFIAPFADLPENVQNLISNAPVTHYFPWRSVSKPDSVSTPTRLVVDPSMSLLNLNIAKGDPQIASLFSVLLRSRSNPNLWSADIKKLYNMLVLETECLPYSLFLYNPSLDPSEEPHVYVLLRAWYGTASTGGQATHALRQLGRDHIDSHPAGSKALLQDLYVDDLLRATLTREDSLKEVAEVQEILARGGMSLKFVAFSHEPPPKDASLEVDSMATLGYKYYPEADHFSLNLGEINFQKKVRGAKPPNPAPCDTPETIEEAIASLPCLTRRHVVAKSAEIFDPLGLFEPYKAMLKRHLARLNSLSWDDPIPEVDRNLWGSQLKLWPDLGMLRSPRSAVPPDALRPLQARIICNTDASESCAGACVYLSFKLLSGSWSSQLLSAKSKLVNFSVPRNELEALVIGVELCFAVVVSLGNPLVSLIIASDSLVAISWALNEKARNKTFVFNRVLTIQRYLRWIRDCLQLTDEVELVHIPGSLNAADLLTKGVVSLPDVSISSSWQSGLEWMRRDVSLMPLTRYSDITLSQEDVAKFLSETISDDALMQDTSTGSTHFCLYPTASATGQSLACVVCPSSSSPQHPRPLPSAHSAWFGEGTHSMLNKENTEFKRFCPTTEHLLDPIRLGWGRANRVLSKSVEFIVRLCHRTHMNSSNSKICDSLAARCTYCKVGFGLEENKQGDQVSLNDPSHTLPSPPVAFSDSVGAQAISIITKEVVDHYWNTLSTLLCKSRIPAKELIRYEEDPHRGWLFYKGRLSRDSKISVLDLDLLNLSFLDGQEIRFCNPCILPDTVIFYSYTMWVHLKSAPHMGLESTLLELMKRFHPIRPRRVLGKILADCVKCKVIQRKVLEHEMAKHKSLRFTLAPPFTFCMGDLAQDFYTKSRFSGRHTMKAPALVLCCLLSGATAIYMLEDWSTQSVVQALERHSCRYGFPTQLFVDSGSQLKKLASVEVPAVDLSTLLHSKFFCELIVAPPKSHSSQGRVERRIGIIKTTLSKLSESGFLLSFLGWETLFSRIANDLNNLPMARASSTGLSRPEWNVLTPNRLLLGRNNKRSLTGPLVIDSTPSHILDRISTAQEEWYRIFVKQLHLFVPSPKWFTSDQIKDGDIVLFFMDVHFKSANTKWHYGWVIAVADLTLTIEYTVPPSDTKKSIQRSKRDVVRIAHESELDFNTEVHAQRVFS